METAERLSPKVPEHIEMGDKILMTLEGYSPEQQNEIISHILINLKKARVTQVQNAQMVSEDLSKSYQGLMEVIKMV